MENVCDLYDWNYDSFLYNAALFFGVPLMAEEIAELTIQEYTYSSGGIGSSFQDLVGNKYFQQYYSYHPGKFAYKVNSGIDYATDIWEMPSEENCHKKFNQLWRDESALNAILMIS